MYQDLGYTSGHSDGGPTVMMGQTQFGGASYNTTHASHYWGVKEIPTPKQMVSMLDQWVVGQPQAKKVSGGSTFSILANSTHNTPFRMVCLCKRIAVVG
jgi:hypothetical protein